MKTFAAAEGGTSLLELKTQNPLLICEIMPGKYILIDGNHKIVIQWNDVSIFDLFIYFN